MEHGLALVIIQINFIIGHKMKAKFKILPGNVLFTIWANDTINIIEVKEIMEKMLIYIEKYGLIKYIDDISKCEVNWEEADKWIIGDWYERALTMGVVKNALIVKKGVDMNHIDDQCEIKSFNELKDALIWIYT